MVKNYSLHYIAADATAREALKALDRLGASDHRTLFVLDAGKMVGTLSDGDIRRGLLQDKEISDKVADFMNKTFRRLTKDEVNPETLANFRKDKIWLLPVLNENDEITDVVDLKNLRTVIPAAVLIMAGGRGERLRPLTDSMPKPMLTVGDRPILEINIDWLSKFGITRFYISLGYMGEKIKNYFGDGSAKGISITYLEEEIPLGTLGSCSLLPELEYDQLIVMNADILTNIDFGDFYNYYKNKQVQMCSASIPYKVNVPYGIMELENNEYVTALVEKPTYTFYANAGIYMISKELIRGIPKAQHYNATDLMQKLIDEQRSGLVHYPILQYWLDIGKYEDYVRAQQDFKHISF